MPTVKNRNESGENPDSVGRSQTLYRKWRSQTFGELVGQESVTRTLKNAITAGRVGHAYLFCGPRGTGKTSTARLLAKAINCLDNDPTARPCNRCEACRSIADGRAMDLIEIDAASNRGIDEIRELREKINFQPSVLRKKLYIIDEVHMLTEPAFNALLKTLEEPPPHAIFVLATTDPQDIPATVVSRCQRFDFQRINLEQIASRLKFICDEEKVKAEVAALELVARQATGSLRDALSLLDQLIVFSGGSITVDSVRAMLGVMNNEAVPDFVDALITRDMSDALEQINKLVQAGSDLKRFNRDLVDHLRGIMLLKANPASRELLDLPRETLERMGQQAGRLELNVLVGLLKTFSAVDYNLKVSPYVQLPLELAVMESLLSRGATQPAMQPVQVQPVTPVQQPQPQPIKPVAPAQPPVVASRQTAANIRPVNSVTSAEENEPPLDIEPPADYPEEYRAKSAPKVEPKTAELASQKSKIPAKAVEAPATPTVATPTVSKPEPGIPETVINFEEVQKLWPRLREVIGLSQKMVQALLADARPVRVEGKHIIIAFKYQFHCEKVSQERTRAMVEENYSKLLGYTTYIRCVLEGQFEPTNSDGGANRNKAEAKSAPVIDERSRAAARIFNATIQDFD